MQALVDEEMASVVMVMAMEAEMMLIMVTIVAQ